MTAVAFDTLKFAERLESGGFTSQQARTAAEAFAEATGQELATKNDLYAVKGELQHDTASLRSELQRNIAAVRSDLEKLELRLTVKLGGLIVAGVAALAALKLFG